MLSKSTQITSLANPSVKRVMKLREARERKKTGLMIVEGMREIDRALSAGVKFQEIFFCPDYINEVGEDILKKWNHKNIRLTEVTKVVFSKVSYGDRQEGLVGIGVQPQRLLSDWKLKSAPLIVVLENVEKPGNLGAVLRSCDGAGIDGVIVCDNQTDIYNPNVIRSSVGTIFSLPVVQCSNEEAYEFLQKNRIKILVALVEAKTAYTAIDLRCAIGFVMGSEPAGLSHFWKKHFTEAISIPLRGQADSLNVSTAAAILIYETLRQRG